MIKNVIFDIGNVILDYDFDTVLNKFTKNKQEQKFLLDNVINSPEWMGNSLVDSGYVNMEDAIKLAQDRTNHVNDEAIANFWRSHIEYGEMDKRVINLIKRLKENGYKVYLLSNCEASMVEYVGRSGIYNIVDGYVFSYREHQIKPNESIYYTLLNRYNLKAEESVFLDDSIKNVDTAKRIGMVGVKVEPDNYESVRDALCSLNLIKDAEYVDTKQVVEYKKKNVFVLIWEKIKQIAMIKI